MKMSVKWRLFRLTLNELNDAWVLFRSSIGFVPNSHLDITWTQ